MVTPAWPFSNRTFSKDSMYHCVLIKRARCLKTISSQQNILEIAPPCKRKFSFLFQILTQSVFYLSPEICLRVKTRLGYSSFQTLKWFLDTLKTKVGHLYLMLKVLHECPPGHSENSHSFFFYSLFKLHRIHSPTSAFSFSVMGPLSTGESTAAPFPTMSLPLLWVTNCMTSDFIKERFQPLSLA